MFHLSMTSKSLVERDASAESVAKWQKHAMVALWVFLALLLVIGVAYSYAKSHGFLQSSPENTPAPVPTAWP
jgi:hypothetical protein